MHIAEPIQEYQTDEEENDEFTFNAFNISDTEESEELEGSEEISLINRNDINAFEDTNNNVLNSEQWIKLIDNWIEMVNAENNNERITETYDDFEVGGHDIHPADNTLAKWKLLDLFN